MRMGSGIVAAVVVSAAGLAAGMGAARPAAAVEARWIRAEDSVTLKPKFEVGQEIKYVVRIRRTDASVFPNAPTGPATPAMPAPAADKPADAKPAADKPAADKPADGKPGETKPTDSKPAGEKTAEAGAATPTTQRLEGQTGADTEALVVLKVTEAGEGGVKMDMTLQSIKSTLKMPAGEFVYDSAKPEDDKDKDNLAMQAFKPVVGGTLKLTCDKDGVITAVDSAGLPAPMNASRQYVDEWISQDKVRMRWNAILHAKRGGGTVKVGEVWSSDEAQTAKQMGGKFETVLSHTLKSVEGGTAKIQSDGSMRLVPLDANAKLPFEVKDVEMKGSSEWAANDGLSKRFELHQKFTLAGTAQGLSITRASQVDLSVSRAE